MKTLISRVRRSDDGIAMLTALLLIMIVTAVAIAVSGLLISETRPTQNANKSQRTVAAATAGFDAALNRIRAANDGAGNGIRVDLPCTVNNANSATMTGNVSQDSGALTYSVRIRYYASDPTNQPDSWLNSTSNMISCAAGYPSTVPTYAYIESTGRGTDVRGTKANTGNRTLHTVYQLHTTNVNIAGGRLGENTTSLCMDAGSLPTAGTVVKIVTCGALGTPSQTWSYLGYTNSNNLEIEWTGSANSNLCLYSPPTSGTAVTLQTCAAYPGGASPWTTSAWATQAWSFDDSGHFRGTDQSSGDYNAMCLGPNTSTPASGATLYNIQNDANCANGGFSYFTWNSDPQVGAGQAGATYNNLVNYQEFARCMDVTDQEPGRNYLIDYPCKQRANTGLLTWNQLWAANADGSITTNVPSGKQIASGLGCLTVENGAADPTGLSAGGWGAIVSSPAPASGDLVEVQHCPSPVGAYQKWTLTGNTGDYATSYNVKTANGLCLAIRQPGFQDTYHQQYGKIVVETCDGSLRQKWNAPPNLIAQPLKGTQEGTGGG